MSLYNVVAANLFLATILVSAGVQAQNAAPPPMLTDAEDEAAPDSDDVAPDDDDWAPDAEGEASAPTSESVGQPGDDAVDEHNDRRVKTPPPKKKKSAKRRRNKKRTKNKRPSQKRKAKEDPLPGIMLHGAALGTTAFVGGVGTMAVVGIGPAFVINTYLHSRGPGIRGVVSTEETALTFLAYGAIFVAPAVAAVVTVLSVGLAQGFFVPGPLEQSLIGVFTGVVVVVLSAVAGLVALLPAGAFAAFLWLDAIFGPDLTPPHYWSNVALATVVFSTAGVAVASLVAGGIGLWSGYAALDDPQE